MAPERAIGLTDSHAHVWDRSCTIIPDARHRPAYEATAESYMRVLDRHGIERAVLVQPSFLGTDNSYLLACLKANPDRFVGIVVLDPSVSDAALDEMSAAGVIGQRYNLIGRDPQMITEPPYRDLTRRLTERGWWIQVQARGRDWPGLAPAIAEDRAALIVDHFGLPEDGAPPLAQVLTQHAPAAVRIKLSAPYRQSLHDIVPAARALVDRFGPEACLWGSDWPWTQHEQRHGYAETIAWLEAWMTGAERTALIRSGPIMRTARP